MKKALIVLVCVLVVSTKGQLKANLLVNGSFESGIGWRDNVPLGSTGITGWTVTRAKIDLVDWYWQGSHGARSLDLNGSPGIGGIAQVFATEQGQLYEVQFNQAANPDLGSRISHIGVQAAGQSEQYAFDCTGYNRSNMGWAARTWQFMAVDTTTTLEFYSLDIGDSWKGPALDNIIVTAIPEPATISLLGLGGLASLKKRRK